MAGFIDAAIGFPTAIYTALLAVVLLYWLLAIVGMVDFESSGIDLDIDTHVDGEIDDLGTVASYVVAFGLNGVPFSIAVSLIVLVAWTLACLAAMWLLPLVPTTILRTLAGLVVLGASFAAALPATAALIRPLRRLFVSHNALPSAALVGHTCCVLTHSVDERFGRAEVTQRGAGINIRVWARTPNALTKGSPARIVDYDAAGHRYLIEAES